MRPHGDTEHLSLISETPAPSTVTAHLVDIYTEVEMNLCVCFSSPEAWLAQLRSTCLWLLFAQTSLLEIYI